MIEQDATLGLCDQCWRTTKVNDIEILIGDEDEHLILELRLCQDCDTSKVSDGACDRALERMIDKYSIDDGP